MRNVSEKSCTENQNTHFLLRMRNFSEKSCTENQNTQFFVQKHFTKNLTVYDIMWKNIVEWYRPQVTIWRLRIW
jgi:hypothetical protein